MNRHIFTGQEHDENTGLIYFGARYYDPDIARFITQDTYLGEPNTPPSLHRYLYAYGNPTVYVDLMGYQSEREDENDKPNLRERISSWLSFPERIATWLGERAGEWFTKTRGQYQAGIQGKLAEQIDEDPEVAKEAAFQEAAVIGEKVEKEAAETAESIIQGALEYATGKALSIIGGIRGVKGGLKKPALTVEDSAGKASNKLRNLSELAEKEKIIAKESKVLKEVVEKESKIVEMEAVGRRGPKLSQKGLVTPKSSEIKVIGRTADTQIAKGWSGHDVLDLPRGQWTPAKNAEWVNEGIRNKQTFYTASPEKGNLIQTSGPYKGQPTVYATELQQLKNAGYVKIGDYYVHPDKAARFVIP